MSLFRLDASILPATSASRALGDLVEREWLDAHEGAPVVRRDLVTTPIQPATWVEAVTATQVPDEQRTADQRDAIRFATELADELIAADALLFTVPIYNYGVSQHIKGWFDLVYTDPRVGVQDGTVLRGKPAVLVTVLGGNYAPGTPRAGWDHSTEWLRRVLVDVWGLDLRVVERSFTLVGVNPALDEFADVAADIKSAAEKSATESGRELAAAVAAAA